MQSNRCWTYAAVFLGALSVPASADTITDWNEKAVSFVVSRAMLPPQAERVIAAVHVAMFDAVNSIERRYLPYRVQLPASKDASREAAAASAAATVLAALLPNASEEASKALQAYLAALPQNAGMNEGKELGAAVGTKIAAERANDGANAPDSYRPKTKAGVYVPTPVTASSMWPNVRPFAMNSPSQFRPSQPIPLKSQEWAADYNEIKLLGARNSAARTARQTEDGRFWLMTGPVSYYPIVRQVAVAKNMSLVDCARFMALASTAVADSFIAVFDAKYHYDFWRPVTAIRNGDIDGNPKTERDPTWLPLDNTPMHPEYPCAHCISSAAIASVIEVVLGGADIPEVTMTSTSGPGLTRRYTNVWAYSDEVSAARIYAGFHYRFSARVGQDMGRKIGRFVVETTMKPPTVADAVQR